MTPACGALRITRSWASWTPSAVVRPARPAERAHPPIAHRLTALADRHAAASAEARDATPSAGETAAAAAATAAAKKPPAGGGGAASRDSSSSAEEQEESDESEDDEDEDDDDDDDDKDEKARKEAVFMKNQIRLIKELSFDNPGHRQSTSPLQPVKTDAQSARSSAVGSGAGEDDESSSEDGDETLDLTHLSDSDSGTDAEPEPEDAVQQHAVSAKDRIEYAFLCFPLHPCGLLAQSHCNRVTKSDPFSELRRTKRWLLSHTMVSVCTIVPNPSLSFASFRRYKYDVAATRTQTPVYEWFGGMIAGRKPGTNWANWYKVHFDDGAKESHKFSRENGPGSDPEKQQWRREGSGEESRGGAGTPRSPKEWTKKEVKRLRQLVDRDGEGDWDAKALLMAAGQSGVALKSKFERLQHEAAQAAGESGSSSNDAEAAGTSSEAENESENESGSESESSSGALAQQESGGRKRKAVSSYDPSAEASRPQLKSINGPAGKKPKRARRVSDGQDAEALAEMAVTEQSWLASIGEGSKLQARDKSSSDWYRAKVVSVDELGGSSAESKLLIHYMNWSDKHDFWAARSE